MSEWMRTVVSRLTPRREFITKAGAHAVTVVAALVGFARITSAHTCDLGLKHVQCCCLCWDNSDGCKDMCDTQMKDNWSWECDQKEKGHPVAGRYNCFECGGDSKSPCSEHVCSEAIVISSGGGSS